MATNKERYKRAFSALHSSPNTTMEVMNMLNGQSNNKKRRGISRAMAACLTAVLVIGSSLAAYAANIGGIQQKVQIWIHGDPTDAIIEFDGQGNYNLEYEDENGNIQTQGGGGVAYGPFGKERPLTEEELLAELNSPRVEEENGVWTVSYYGQVHNITDKFDADGICYLQLIHDGETLYMTITKEHGFASSSKYYVDAKELID